MMSAGNWDNLDQAQARLQKQSLGSWDNYLGFYSSWLGGYFREPWAMQLPLDDHGFHRGDAVFEAIRLTEGGYFDLPGHLQRLERSAQAIGMKLPKSLNEIETICLELARRAGSANALLRLFVSRGPGGFSPSPAEVVGHQVYAALTKFKPMAAELYSNGCTAILSRIPAKEPFWSQIKSCNYLQNVLMRQECLEKGSDFAICIDAQGRLCEGSTENMFVLREGRLQVPKFDYTLRGTTIRIMMKLAEQLVNKGELKAVEFADLQRDDLFAAQEAAFVGTTLAVLPLTKVDGLKIADGRPGPLSQKLNHLLMHAMTTGQEFRTIIAL
jgi:4-amino-4-deoxychorismate lyase